MDIFAEVRKLTKIFPGGIKAVDGVSFEVKKGQILSLLGPSGCGKTTILRCIAGLEIPDSGEIIVEGKAYNSVKKGIAIVPNKRNIGMVFQSYAVWPHMNVFDNIAYGLKMSGAEKVEIRSRVEEVIELVGLQGLADRQVTKLSGGQQQRVAVARALAYKPNLLLFDEPLSNLDAKLREKMRLELIRLQRETGITSIYVTHDQAEAMVISDEIIVMQNGNIQQIGNADEIYNMPRNKFVADFIGIANFLDGEVIKNGGEGNYGIIRISSEKKSYEARCFMSEEIQEGERVALFFRPENVRVGTILEEDEEVNTFEGKISNLIHFGNYIDCRIKLKEREIKAQISHEANLKLNQEVLIKIDPRHCACIKT